MKAIDYLKQIKKLDNLIKNKIDEVDRLMCMATKVTASSDGERVKSSGSQERMADTVTSIIDLKEEINADIDRFINMKRNIMQVIDSLDNADYINLLYCRYYHYMTWEAIACEMGYTYAWICTLHVRALNKMDALLEGKELE